ncbi:MAG: acyl--CoA ligase [Ruminococcus sp.]|nr:acyl--CoA ligase [Ruminococcus sp.]
MEDFAPWYRFYDDIPKTLRYPHKMMWEMVFDNADKYPKYTALRYMGERVTYEQLKKNILRVQSGLYYAGVRRGDRVAVCLPNIPQAVYCLYALNRMGAVSSFLHPLSAVGELEHYLKELDSRYVVTLDSLYPVFSQVRGIESNRKLILTSPADELSPVRRWMYNTTHPAEVPDNKNIVFWKDLMKHECILPSGVSGEIDNMAVVLFSGGTTGVPKGVMLSDQNLNSMGLQTIAMCHCDVLGKSMLAAMPMFHGFGLGVCVHTALIGGACSILVPRFTVTEYAKLIYKYKAEFIAGVPTLFEAILRSSYLKGKDLSFLRGVFSGGDALPLMLKKRFDDFLLAQGSPVKIREGYGATECVTASCLTPYNTDREGSIGVPMPDMLYKICRVGTCEAVPYEEEGEICISGPSVMMGYLNNQEETEATLKVHADGRVWLHSGDVGMMDSDGFVYFRYRLKRIIVASGYNIYPERIERILEEHKFVRQSCVIGVRDSYRMRRIKAFVVLSEGVPRDKKTCDILIEHCRRNIASFALPKEIEFRSSLPVTGVGKVDYKELESEDNISDR